MTGNLLFALAIKASLPYVERTIALTQVVERLSVSSPYRSAVFTTEVGEFGELVAFLQPDVACDSRLMVLAEEVFIALVVVIEHVTLSIDADVLHRDDGEHTGATALGANFVNLREVAR